MTHTNGIRYISHGAHVHARLCVQMCVCVRECERIRICVFLCVKRACMCAYVFVSLSVRSCAHVCVCMYAHECVCACVYKYMHVRTCASACVCANICVILLISSQRLYKVHVGCPQVRLFFFLASFCTP